MTIVLFIGPTLSPEEARGELDAVVLPPAAQGDVLRAALGRPRAIGIVDGTFERVPAVWHKEILWAMAEGVHVFGSASMGALRAAELAPFGMEGVGAIYEAVRRGDIEDDDEVAVAHGLAEHGYRAVSEAMVNLRATLARAEAEGVLRPATRRALARIAKELFYAERSYPAVLSLGAQRGLPAAELAALRAFLPAGRVDQKRLDALAMLRAMRERFAGEVAPKRVRYTFEHTDAWEQARRRAREGHSVAVAARPELGRPAQAPDAGAPLLVLEALRLSGGAAAVAAAQAGALGRALALEEARQRGVTVGADMLQATADEFRRERGLLEPEELDRWLAEQRMTRDGFVRLMIEEAQVRWVQALFTADAQRCLPDWLRVMGEYGPLLARAHGHDGEPTCETPSETSSETSMPPHRHAA